MQPKYQIHKYPLLLLSFLMVMIGCKDKEYIIPDPVSQLSNDVIKRSLGPNIVNFLPMEFAYAMALPKDQGKLVSAQVEASIAGGTGTFLEHRSFYTGGNGADVPVVVGSPSVNDANRTSVSFTVDTNAATLRYFYVVPEEARGKSVSFTFSATSSDGKTATYTMGPYNISKMDIKRTLAVSNNNNAYISIEDMAVYNATTAAANAGKIDLVYLYRTTPSAFTHGFVSPAADPQYLPGVTLPAGVNRNTKIRKSFGVADFNLVRSFGSYTSSTTSGNYIEDRDFQEIDLTDSPNFATGMRAESGMWVQTADGKYRAFVFVNTINNNSGGSAVISILRYAL